MPEKDATTIKALLDALQSAFPWLATIVLSIFAAIAQYAGNLRGGLETWQLKNLLLDATICVFVGTLTHLVCEWQEVDGVLRSILVAINAHMGTRAMMQYEKLRDRLLGQARDQ